MVRGKPELRTNSPLLLTLLVLLLPALSGCTGGPAGNTTTQGSSDPPTAPSNLVATGASSTQVNLAWGASTDAHGVTGYMVERCTGANCSNFTQIGTTSGATNYSDTGLTVNTSYSYRVRATDAAGLLSGYSNVASATTPDTTVPTAPANLKAADVSSTDVNLTWAASTDLVGVTGYLIERCTGNLCSSFSQIGTTNGTTTAYSDTSVIGGTSYSYRVRATDAAGNKSGYSNVSSTTTAGPPTAPSNLTATAVSTTQINLSWTASTDAIGVTGYLIERCSGAGCSSFAQIATTGGGATTYSDMGLTAATSYSYRVRATDAANLLSGYSNVATATTQSTAPPTAPSNLMATGISSTQINLSWTASTDPLGLSLYLIERCAGAGCSSFTQVATTGGSTTAYSDTGLTVATSYSYRVRAKDTVGSLSSYSNVATASTPDTTPPTAPSNLTATGISSTQINLSWTGSTDNVGVTGYLIERCSGAGCSSFAQIATTAGGTTTYSNTGLTVLTSYSYRVRATDAAGNKSGYSNVATASTPDTTPPTAPSNLTATGISSTQINLSWSASTDNVGVTGYQIWRCTGSGCSSFAQIATTAGGTTTYSNTGLSASTTYTYEVRATDAAANLSSFSNTAAATTQSSGGSSITVSVSPRRGGLTVTQTLSITATLTNDTTNAGVTWSTSTGTGSFSSTTSTSGVPVTFTAPSSAGVLTITATSNADGSKTATATIGVTDLAGVATYLYGNSRQGSNSQEYALTTSGVTAVNSTNFGQLFSCTVDAAIYAQPLWVANLSISSAKHNVVFVATEHDTMYAFDADSNSSPCTPLWTANLLDASHGGASGETWVTSSDDGCGDMQPDVGIVGTPVLDLATGTLYVVSTSNNSGTFRQRLHALDATSGSEKFSGPSQAIAATVPGTGSGSSGGQVSFDALINNQRSALLLVNGHVVISWASHCDNGPYHGWIMSYNASTLAREAVFNTSPNGINSGVWMSGGGPSTDSSGNIYIATGNGTFDVNSGGVDYGDAVIKLAPPSGGSFSVLSYFRGNTITSPDIPDTDQGAGGVILFPTVNTKSHLAQAGKDGNIYVMDSVSLGGYNSSSNNVVQELAGALTGGIWGSPTYWNGSAYFGGQSAPLQAYSFDTTTTATLSTTPTSDTTLTYGFPGPTVSASSNGASNGIVWALDNHKYCTDQSLGCGPAVLHAYDATNLATEFWNSSQNAGDAAGFAVKFTVPTVVNGKVYVGTRGNDTGTGGTSIPGQLNVYGLKPN